MHKGKFKTTKERLAKSFENWAEKYMSAGAKEVLIKSVAQAIPTYVMGVFKLPNTLCEEIERMIQYFWWSEENGQRKGLELFNQTLLARQAWRLIEFPESLCARLLKARYFPNGELVDMVFRGEV